MRPRDRRAEEFGCSIVMRSRPTSGERRIAIPTKTGNRVRLQDGRRTGRDV
jgi:hypothetical protein